MTLSYQSFVPLAIR